MPIIPLSRVIFQLQNNKIKKKILNLQINIYRWLTTPILAKGVAKPPEDRFCGHTHGLWGWFGHPQGQKKNTKNGLGFGLKWGWFAHSIYIYNHPHGPKKHKKKKHTHTHTQKGLGFGLKRG
jgi:hypothetical protein